MLQRPYTVSLLILFLTALFVASASAQVSDEPLELKPVAFDTSPPLRSIEPSGEVITRGRIFEELRRLPPISRPRISVTRRSPVTSAPGATPLNLEIRTFDGPHGADDVYPSDSVGAVGLNHYVAWVNTNLVVYDKTGKPSHPPVPGRSIWSGFSNAPCRKQNDGDPIVLYDQFADRWVLSQFAITNGPPFYQCLAVSTTPDPLGPYTRVAYRFEHLNDYGKLGLWSNAYLATFYMFTDLEHPEWMGPLACAIDRNSLLAGRPASMICADLPKDALGVMPATIDGRQLPAQTTPGLFVGFGANRLELWELSYSFSKPKQTTISGPRSVAVDDFTQPAGNVDVGTGAAHLDAVGDRLMYRVPLRVDGEMSTFTATHSVQTDAGRVGVRWYEVDLTGRTASVRQQGTFALPDGKSRWLGTIAADRRGNLMLGYSAAGVSAPAGLYLSGRTPGYAAGQLGPEVSLVGERKAQVNSDRWGDYSAITVDPSDDCTFWYIGQYTPKTDSDRWATLITTARFPDCRTTR